MNTKKRVPRWIDDEFRRDPTLKDQRYLTQAIESAAVTPRHWEQLRKRAAFKAPSSSPLFFLEWALRDGIEEFKPARQLTLKQRETLATRIRKSCDTLAQDLENVAIHLDWSHGQLYRARLELLAGLADRYSHVPTDHVQRTLPAFKEPILQAGWQEGAHAALQSLPDLLRILAAAADEWGSQDPSAALLATVPRPTSGHPDRTFFLKVLTAHFRRQYSVPLREFTAALSVVFFPDAPAIDPKRVGEIAP